MSVARLPFALLVLAACGDASHGGLDTSFGVGGLAATPAPTAPAISLGSMAIDSRDRIVVAGTSVTDWMLRLSSDGTLDATFGSAGITDSLGHASIQIDSLDRILVVGNGYLVRHGSDGRYDPGFGSAGSVSLDLPLGTGRAAIQRDGRILVVTETVGELRARRFDDGGQLEVGFGGQVLTRMQPQVALRDAGQGVVFAGYDRAIRLTDDGALSATSYIPLGPELGPPSVRASVHFDDGLVVGGVTPGGFVARFHADGVFDQSFGVAGYLSVVGLASVGGLAADAEGYLLVAGTVDRDGRRWGVMRLDPTGWRDPSFGDGGIVAFDIGADGSVHGMGLQRDGRIVIVGRRGDSVLVARLVP